MRGLPHASMLFAFAIATVESNELYAQAFPSRPMRILTAEQGGGADIMARTIARGISASLGQPVIVENRPTSRIDEVMVRSTPDGYTMLLGGTGLWLSPLVQKIPPYDPLKVFSPITPVTRSPFVLTVSASLPVKSVKELIALAKARPGELNYSSGRAGGSSHLAPELFKSMAAVNIVRIPYKGAGPALAALLSGQVHMNFSTVASMMPHVKAGKLTALAVTSAQPSPLYPGLPSVAATLPGYELVSVLALFAPPKTPAPIINRLNGEIARMLDRPEERERLLNSGMEPVTTTPAEFLAQIKSDLARMGKVIKDAGIEAD